MLALVTKNCYRGERVGRRVRSVGIGRLRLLLRLGVEKMMMAEKRNPLNISSEVTKLERKLREQLIVFSALIQQTIRV